MNGLFSIASLVEVRRKNIYIVIILRVLTPAKRK